MNIDWKRKLTSRKFWAAVCNFVGMLVIAFGASAGTAEKVTALIMAGATVIAYIIAEGLVDAANVEPFGLDIVPEAEPPEEAEE
jgi:hypothetical protein